MRTAGWVVAYAAVAVVLTLPNWRSLWKHRADRDHLWWGTLAFCLAAIALCEVLLLLVAGARS